jgi:Transposase
MSVYVGMDVHRKRSQVAVVDQAGAVQRNRNVPNDPAELSTVLGALPAGTPVAFEAAYGWGWLVELLEGLELEPRLVHPSRCKAIASARLKNDKVDAQPWRSCSAAICCLRRGSLPSRSVTCARCCATASAWCACRPCARTGSTRCWPTVACASTAACGPLPGGRGLPPWSSHPWHDRSPTTAAR